MFTLSYLIVSPTIHASVLDPILYPGVKVSDGISPPYAPTRPRAVDAPGDVPLSYKDRCHKGASPSSSNNFKLCVYGTTAGYTYTIALVGDSHTAHWLPAIQTFASNYKIRILYATKTGCAFSATLTTDYLTCNTFNAETYRMLLKYKPDAVVGKADQYAHDGVPSGFLTRFRQLGDYGIRVIAIRNTAYWKINVPECVKTYGRNNSRCLVKREDQQPVLSNWSRLSVAQRPANVKYIDYAPRMCTINYCYPVQGNIMKIRDKNHMTDSYSRTFGPYLLKDMLPVIREARVARLAL